MGLMRSFILLACSGPGAGAAIRQNIVIANYCAAIGGVITIAVVFDAWRTRRWGIALPISVVMSLMHPAWTISALHGDCGFLKRNLSYFVSAIYFGLLVYQSFAAKRRPTSAPPSREYKPVER